MEHEKTNIKLYEIEKSSSVKKSSLYIKTIYYVFMKALKNYQLIIEI